MINLKVYYEIKKSGQFMNKLYKMKRVLKSIIFMLMSFSITIKEFYSNISFNGDSKRKRLESELLVTVHSLEKGMGLRKTRKGYGKEKAIKVENLLKRYLDCGYDTKKFAFIESIKILDTYIELQKSWNEDIEEIKEKYNLLMERIPEVFYEEMSDLMAGYKTYNSRDLEMNREIEFAEFISSRHSIRDYKYEVVDKNIVEKAIELANQSPSACNRQPIKVYCTKNLKEAEDIDNLISGTAGFKGIIPNFAVVTADRAYFSGAEQYQWYTNGGIYIAYLSLAFHALGIGNCIMQWFAFYKNEKALKAYFSISKTEAIIGIVGYGYYSDYVKCIFAQRKPVSATLKYKA